MLFRSLGGDIGLLVGGTMAIIGHDYPVFFGFKGGKGIATSWGLIIAVNPWIALILLVLVLLIVGFSRYMSVGSLCAALLYPILTAILQRGKEHYLAFILFAIFASGLTIFCHRANIVRLFRREENRLDFKKISSIKSKIRNFRK